MKKTIGIAAMLLCATLAQALPEEDSQAQSTTHQIRPDATSRLVDKLALTDEQKKEIAEIRKRTVEDNASFLEASKRTLDELQAARESNDTAKIESLKRQIQSQRDELKQIREAELERIMDILTREQHIQFEELKAAREARKKPQE